MARMMNRTNEHLYRAVVTVTSPDGRTGEFIYGPFTTPGAAKAKITTARNSYWNRHNDVAGVVEVAAVSWEAQP